jgi:CheY-like chemotaxis protein
VNASSEPFNTPASSGSADLALPDGKSFAEVYPLRILVADDNYINRRVFMMFLTHLGYRADCVENGLECMKAGMSGGYDLILSDLDMPVMSGLECAQQLRTAGVTTRIIAVSASEIENVHEVCRAAGMDGFLPKPIPADDFRQALRDAYMTKMTSLQDLPSLD